MRNLRNLAALMPLMAMGMVSSELQPEPPRNHPPAPKPSDDAIAAKYRQERLERKRANYAKRNGS